VPLALASLAAMPIVHLSLFAAWTDAWVPCDILPLTNYRFLCPSFSDRGRGLLVQPLSAAYPAQHGLSLFLAKDQWWIGWRERLTELSGWNTINSRTRWWTHTTWVNTEDFVLRWSCSFSGCSLLFICRQRLSCVHPRNPWDMHPIDDYKPLSSWTALRKIKGSIIL